MPANFVNGGRCLFAHEEHHPGGGDLCASYTTTVVFLCLFCNVSWYVSLWWSI